MRIGIDVGGTNTDAVALAGEDVIAWAKVPTTDDIASGIVNAIRSLIDGGLDLSTQPECVIIGTVRRQRPWHSVRRQRPWHRFEVVI